MSLRSHLPSFFCQQKNYYFCADFERQCVHQEDSTNLKHNWILQNFVWIHDSVNRFIGDRFFRNLIVDCVDDYINVGVFCCRNSTFAKPLMIFVIGGNLMKNFRNCLMDGTMTQKSNQKETSFISVSTGAFPPTKVSRTSARPKPLKILHVWASTNCIFNSTLGMRCLFQLLATAFVIMSFMRKS